MAKTEKIRLGMIGGGQGAFIGAVHRHAAGLDGHYELVCGAFSRNQENNLETAESLSISADRAYDSWQALIEQESKLPEEQRVQVLGSGTPARTGAREMVMI